MSLRFALAAAAALAASAMLAGPAAAAPSGARATAPIVASPSPGGGPSSSFTGTGTLGRSDSSEGLEGREGAEGSDGSHGFGTGSASFGPGGAPATRSSGPGGAISGLSVAAIRRLQTQLARLGYFRHAVTGFYGAITTEAVKRFQRASGLKPDGIWGPRSAAALAKRVS